MLADTAKLLLLNSIKSARTHNRFVEEQELWQRKVDNEKRTPYSDERRRQRRSASPDNHQRQHRRCRSRSYERRSDGSRSRRQMPEDYDRPCRQQERSPSNVWLRRLAECKDADPDKWHHDGFKELYPEALQEKSVPLVDISAEKEFTHSTGQRSSPSSSSHTRRRERKKHRRIQDSPDPPRDKRSKSHRKHKRRKFAKDTDH